MKTNMFTKLLKTCNACNNKEFNICGDMGINSATVINKYGRKLEANRIVMIDSSGKLVESHSGMCLAKNGKELDLLIAWMETLRKQMPE
ncbi:hypothetical protein FR830_25380 (plasmid) [Klebsiella aerogenes]|uniref:hypothetical protein n=1 Tax=Klebsiella aerogenes TaxID=548 RepID=UPI00124BD229|nr:hypothetical protein [Klebsiella aerogenes]QFI19940.1 hypothetical protein FR830_25380 [Klebsiella aerogenes]